MAGQSLVPVDRVANHIFVIRGKRVMLDRDLAELYGVETKALNQAVTRNIDRFPEDFMFRITAEELGNTDRSRSQIVTLNRKRGSNIKYPPRVFTEQGVAMLSSVLASKRAIRVNIQIIRAFIHLRELLATNAQLRTKMEAMEKKYDRQLLRVFTILQSLVAREGAAPVRKIGFSTAKMRAKKQV